MPWLTLGTYGAWIFLYELIHVHAAPTSWTSDSQAAQKKPTKTWARLTPGKVVRPCVVSGMADTRHVLTKITLKRYI